MINAKELRIGNWILNTVSNPVQVNIYILTNIDSGLYEAYYSHIPLTEEWLLKFEITDRFKRGYEIKPLSGRAGAFALFYKGDHTGTFIKYVHQLQNLYFALTGEELQINGLEK